MADINDQSSDGQSDSRIACKYGTKCYQKNPLHLQKYKHPPSKRPSQDSTTNQNKKFKMNVKDDIEKINEIETASDNDTIININPSNKKENAEKEIQIEQQNIDVDKDIEITDLGRTAKTFNVKQFIKEKFMVEMPEDFYSFWEFCKSIKEKCPQEAFKDVGLSLVGPYDVLAGKFYDIPEQSRHNYLIHWRYYYDPPECQTVVKGTDRTGYHIGYYRDFPKEPPVFLVSNLANTDGVFKVMGENIFAAVYLYLEELKKNGDPFKKVHIARFQSALKKKTEELQLNLNAKTQKIGDRDKTIVTRSFNKLGIVVPYDRRTQVGYRNLGITNKELSKLLSNIQEALPEQKQKYLSALQDILTNVSIATDECDFGTGIELGLDILAHGVNSLNQTISRVLVTSYRLINREEFAQIAEAHMNNRKKGTNLSIL